MYSLGKFIEDIWASLSNSLGKFALIQTGLGNITLAQIFKGTLISTKLKLKMFLQLFSHWCNLYLITTF